MLIISADQYNRSRLPTVTVAVITTARQLVSLPGNVLMAAVDSGLPEVLNVTQIATIDRQALEVRIGQLPDWLIAQVDTGVARALGLIRR